METNGLYDQKTEDLYASCDLLLIKLYFQMDVIRGFPDVPEETAAILENLGLLILKEERYCITPEGKHAVSLGGVKKYMKDRDPHFSETFSAKRRTVFLEYPVIVGALLSLLMLLCFLTWFVVSN